ncbi:polysaccharide deacetylase family protein [Kitasatospora kifunensis]|uniref:Peptidoglycan/xylan/chitin deacetylase (PgdA/CDA1 family) n=1 Tax=Kitasatospora kifunensis TaxID=58351 RepID=A0A7W7R3Z8_KITKI|nr:polysaccharide deacetylase family protein [Kitasatospora kifunensis]MBB4925015.1 peptidoglycan/xylan/chitin deacetylase (PgdA/CDA1 family) [Kitasatospora kifunensis]
MPIPRPSQSADSSQSVSASAYPSRRRLLAWTTLGAASLASAALAGCSDSAHAHASAAPSGSPAEGPSDSFSPAAPVDPNAASGLPSPATTSPAAVRTKPVFKVHDILPNAPADAIALTIDDGPWPVYTAQVLALLRKYDIRATFNVIGTQAHTYKDLIRQLAADGHTVANHTMTHPQPLSKRTAAQIEKEITDAQSVIVDAGAPAPTLFRSPGGDWSPTIFATAAKYGMTPIDWDVDPQDWKRPGVPKITEKLMAARPGDILLCHDGGGDRSQTLDALKTVLPALKAKGLSFVTL